MTTQSFWTTGGFADHRPGLAALALAVASAPLSATPAGRAAATGGALRAVLAPRGVQLNLWFDPDAAAPADVWTPMEPLGDRAAQTLDGLRRSAARAELNDPLERALHAVETAVWGTSRWSACWGGEEEVYSGQEMSDVLRSWQTGERLPGPTEDAFEVPDLPGHPWADGPVVHHGTSPGAPTPRTPSTGRVELALAIPVTGDHAPAYAAVTAELLGRPHTGLLFDRLRAHRPLAYGIAAVPVVRGARTALAVAVSTTPDRTQECARHLADTVRRLTAEPTPEHLLFGAVTGVLRTQRLAAARVAAAEPPTPQQRCLLEAGPPEPDGAASAGHVPEAARPRWAVHGEVPDRDHLERVLEGAW